MCPTRAQHVWESRRRVVHQDEKRVYRTSGRCESGRGLLQTLRLFPHQQRQPWATLNPKVTSELIDQMHDTLGDHPPSIGDFSCLGKKSLDEMKERLLMRGFILPESEEPIEGAEFDEDADGADEPETEA